MRRVAVFLGMVVVLTLVVIPLSRPVTGQDNHEERISSLETRVAALELAVDDDGRDGPELIGGEYQLPADPDEVVIEAIVNNGSLPPEY